jgi:hypothetical protein
MSSKQETPGVDRRKCSPHPTKRNTARTPEVFQSLRLNLPSFSRTGDAQMSSKFYATILVSIALSLTCFSVGVGQEQLTKDQERFVGTWEITDPRLPAGANNHPAEDIRMTAKGEYKGGSWLGIREVNGIGANTWKFDDDRLSFLYVKAGRPRVDEMLTGKVKWVGKNFEEFDFTFTGGYYGKGRNAGTVMRMRLSGIR